MKFAFCGTILVLTYVMMLIFTYGMRITYEKKIMEQKMNSVQNQCNILANQIVNNNYFMKDSVHTLDSEIEQLASIFSGRIMVVDDKFQIQKDTYTLDQGKYMLGGNVIKAMEGEDIRRYFKKEQYLEIITPITNNTTGEEVGVIICTASTQDVDNVMAHVKSRNKVLYLIFFIVCSIVAIWLSNLLTKQLKVFVEAIHRIADGHMDETIKLKGYTEIKDMADAFNEILNKLNTLENSRQEFVSNVSHELKTPITSIKVLADSLLAQEDAPAEMYREFMEDIVDEIDRENDIINDLLSLVKMDKKASDLNIETINVNELLELLLKRLRPLAAKRNIEIVYESFRPVNAEIDKVKLSLAFSNLIENAIKYNKDDGWVRVSLNADHKFFYVKVTDSGIGIPEDCQDQVFERFYRVDKARSRETGGTGLGLSITRNAILMHKGAIKVHSKEGEGTTFTVRLPLTYVV
ncbi:MAG: HAMP domain-containing sensor histidine kinase [Lachnospiraceae bacterium]|nr:HAMP domain-containing histidine kinase [Lachnospiraceae bacterium]MEE1342350.1 HAMP domain-containing sensor histidine kinase [Lachnospiraceae bacterium]